MKPSSQYDRYDPRQVSQELNNHSNQTKVSNYETSSKRDLLINWVNSIEYPNCLLASDINDFRDGIIFCELINEVVLNNRKPDFLTQVKNNNLTYQDSLYNINMALNEIRSINNPAIHSEVKNLKAHELISDEEKVILLLDCLYRISQNEEAVQNYENNKYNPFEQRRHSDVEKLAPNQLPTQPMLQFHKSDPASTTSTQISPSSIQTNLNKTIQKPPRNSSTPPNRPRNFENTQPINNRNDASPHKEPTQGNVATSNIYHRQNKNSFKSNSVYTPLSQNNPQNNSFLNYDPLNQSQQQQANHDNSTYISKEAINKNESSSIYSNLPHSHIMNYSDIIQNNSFINDADTSKSARRYEQVKQDHTKPFQSSITPIQNKRPSHTPIQSTNPTGMHTNETLYTPAVTEGRSKSPEIFGAGERHSTKSKKSGISVTPTRLTPQNEQKLSTSAIKQRINQLKYQKEKQDSSPIPRSKSIQRLSPFKKNETLSSIKNTEQDRKIVWDDSKKDERIVITSVTEETKSRIMNWLYSITLIKENVSGIEKKLPRICRDGVIFIDLLNRLEGKHETIKGVNRKPENKTHVIANYQKLNNFLGKFEKMNPRYLWAHDYLMQSNEDVFWGFLDDIWHLYNKKVSPYDPRFNRDDRRATLRLQTSTHSAFKDGQKSRRSQLDVSYNDICYYDKSKLNSSYFNATSPVHTKSRSRSRSRSPSENGGYDKLNHSFRSKKNEGTSHLIIDNSLGNYENNGRGSKYDQNQVNAGYQNRYSKRNNMVRSPSQGKFKSIIKKGDASKFFSRSFTESEYDETSTLAAANSISIEGENQVFEWLKTMGFKAMLMRDRSSLFEDPFRNGTLLCYVLGRIENERMHSIYKDPKSIDECRHNVYQAFQVLVRKQTPIPTYLKGKEEAVLKGDRNILLTLLYSIMKINENRVGLNTSVITNTNTDKIYKQEASYIPPYDDNETEQLEASLITWLTCLGILQEFSVKPQSMKELAIHFRNGVILCDLTAIVTNSRLITIHRKPTSELQCMTNIRKALEILRGKKMMAQRYLWREKDIYTGNKYILLGLLEDLHRFFDGLPPRTNPNYFLEGPYIPKRDDNLTQKLKEHRQSFGRIEGGIQPRSSTRIQSPTRSFLIGGSYNSRRGSRDAETKFQDINRTKVREYQNSKLNLSSDEPISIIDYEKKAKSSPVKQHIDGYMSSNLSRWDSYHENGIYKSPKSDMRKVEFPLNSAKFSEINSYKSVPKSYIGEDKSLLNSDEFRNYRSVMSSKEMDLKEWIASLGFGNQVKDLNIEGDVLEEFKDGILLCKIIEALELQAIPGLILKPRTNASKVVNIRKCLNALSKRPGVNPHLLHVEDKILAGDGETIRKLLVSIRDGYRFMNKCLQRTQSPSSSRYIDESIKGLRSERQSGEKWNLYFPQENYVLNSQERKVAIIPPKYSKD